MPTLKRLDAMTVADLIAELEQMPQDALVAFACDYGDICHTKQVLPVANVDEYEASALCESGYSNSGLALCSEDGDADYEDPDRLAGDETYVILQG